MKLPLFTVTLNVTVNPLYFTVTVFSPAVVLSKPSIIVPLMSISTEVPLFGYLSACEVKGIAYLIGCLCGCGFECNTRNYRINYLKGNTSVVRAAVVAYVCPPYV